MKIINALIIVPMLTTIAHLVAGQSISRRRGPAARQPTKGIKVVKTFPNDGTIVKQGQSLRLSCRTNSKWFFCVWRGPGGDKQCAIQESSPQSVCPNDKRIILQGGTNNCDIVLRNARPEDYGEWMCLVSDFVDFDSDRSSLNLEIGRPAEVAFKGKYPKNELEITEGEKAEIICMATGAHPTPQLSWEGPANSKLDTMNKPIESRNRTSRTSNVQHTVTYTADLKDDGHKIKCFSTQLDRDGRTILYESDVELKLIVSKIVVPIDNAFTQKIGIISGVLLAVILLILCCVFIMFALCKKQRQKRSRSRPPSSQDTDDTSPDTTTSIKPIWTTDGPRTSQRNNNIMLQQEERFANYFENRGTNHHHPRKKPSASNITVYTQSTGGGSQGSWEEDRSVGDMVEDSMTSYQPPPDVDLNVSAPSPSLHETHFEGSDFDYPKTVFHHPDPYRRPIRLSLGPHQQPKRPSSSAEVGAPYYPHSSLSNRPNSALESYHNDPYSTLNRPMMPNSSTLLNTSVKSVFECELGCFEKAEIVLEEAEEAPPPAAATSAKNLESGGNQSDAKQSCRTSEMMDV